MDWYAEYGGERSLTAPMTWGQVAIWKSIANLSPYDAYLNQGRALVVDGHTAAEAAKLLGQVLTRYETLRTRVVLTGEEPRQSVERDGRLPIDVVDVSAPTGLSAVQLQHDAQMETRIDNTTDLPLRALFGLYEGKVHVIALVASHFAIDATALRIVREDLRAMFEGRELRRPTGLQPIDLAYHQLEAGPQQRSRRVINTWMSLYDRVPPSALPRASGVPDDAPSTLTTLDSPAMSAASRIIAQKYGVSTSTVLLAAMAAVVTGWTDRPSCSLATIVHNRFQAAHRDIVSPMNQLGLVVIDLADRPHCAELLTRTWQAALQAHWNAYYDQIALDRSLVAAGSDPGIEGHPYLCFNDVRDNDDDAAAPLSENAVRALLDQTKIETMSSVRKLSWQAILSVHTDVDGNTALKLGADIRYLSPDLMERFLLDLEHFVVTAAFRDGPVTDLTRRHR
jgi:hypothetical protein